MPEKKTKRPSPTSLRLRPEVLAILEQCRERTGASFSAQVNESISGKVIPRQQRRPPIEQSLLGQILAECATIKDLLRGIGETSEDRRMLECLGQIKTILLDIRNLLMQRMGRRR